MLANGVSHEGLEIHDHFGPDAAKVLNDYACQVEDALIQTNAQLVEACNLLQELSGEHMTLWLITPVSSSVRMVLIQSPKSKCSPRA
jgi:hypothetical protein